MPPRACTSETCAPTCNSLPLISKSYWVCLLEINNTDHLFSTAVTRSSSLLLHAWISWISTACSPPQAWPASKTFLMGLANLIKSCHSLHFFSFPFRRDFKFLILPEEPPQSVCGPHFGPWSKCTLICGHIYIPSSWTFFFYYCDLTSLWQMT